MRVIHRSTDVPLGAVFFDVDGTLVDSMALKGDALCAAFPEFSERWSELRKFHELNGGLNRLAKIDSAARTHLGRNLSASELEDRATMFEQHIASNISRIKVMPGVRSALEMLGNYVPLFAVSAMPQSEILSVLSATSLESFFASFVGFPTPKSDAIRCLLRQGHIDASRGVLVGDAESDRVAADESEVHFVKFVSESQGRAGDAVPWISSMTQLVDVCRLRFGLELRS